ncbi:hypothetical protein L596_013348 [Steinernema carpocapsae]|uniref:Uncharacterized protein n=1 Tax=Steinernema carpocapsae TaxID=34508 RepID=A0A4U5P0J6_STECR|nr:hypothetical protein L596_013348 [Steinernema carpocapsae]
MVSKATLFSKGENGLRNNCCENPRKGTGDSGLRNRHTIGMYSLQEQSEQGRVAEREVEHCFLPLGARDCLPISPKVS